MSSKMAAFNPQRNDGLPETPSLESVIRRAMRHASLALRVCMPARVVSQDSRHRVDVQPLLQARYLAQSAATTLPVVCGVPVSMPSGQSWAISGPVAVGDQGLLIFADRSMDQWLAGGGEPAEPNDGRLHSISDAIFVPGLLTDSQAAARDDSSTDLALTNGAATVRLQKAGTLILGNGNVELVSLVSELAQAVSALAGAVKAAQVFLPTTPPTPLNVISTATSAMADAVERMADQIKGT